MEKEEFIRELIKEFESLSRLLKIGVIEVLTAGDDGFASLVRREYISGDDFFSLDEIKTEKNFIESPGANIQDIKLNAESGAVVFCKVFPVEVNDRINGFIVIQTLENMDSRSLPVLKFLVAVINLFVCHGSHETAQVQGNNKYKNELIHIRDIQAKLFPKFEEVWKMDIRSAYLPADIMTGNFVDGIFLDKYTYQVAVCEVRGSYAISSFVGAAIRTLLRSEGTKKTAPSVLVEKIIKRLKTVISGIQSLVHLSIYRIDIKTGRVVLSSFGSMTTIFYTIRKKGYINLKDTSVGKQFEKQNFYKDISLILESGDVLLFYSHGVVSVMTEDGSSSYGETRLIENFRGSIQDTSTEIVHSIIDSVYEFSNYSPISEDIMLICMKRE